MQPPFYKTFYFKTADFADNNAKFLFRKALRAYEEAAMYFGYSVWNVYCEKCRIAAVWQNAANWEGPDGAAEKARWLEEYGFGWTAEELDSFKDSEKSYNSFHEECIASYEWPALFTRHHLQDFFHPDLSVGGDVEDWDLVACAEVWEITCDSRERYAFFFALFTAVAQESGTTLRFHCDGMMYEITPGTRMPEVGHSDRECWCEPNEPEHDFYAEEDDDNIPF